jgi:hypothetical protein
MSHHGAPLSEHCILANHWFVYRNRERIIYLASVINPSLKCARHVFGSQSGLDRR